MHPRPELQLCSKSKGVSLEARKWKGISLKWTDAVQGLKDLSGYRNSHGKAGIRSQGKEGRAESESPECNRGMQDATPQTASGTSRWSHRVLWTKFCVSILKVSQKGFIYYVYVVYAHMRMHVYVCRYECVCLCAGHVCLSMWKTHVDNLLCLLAALFIQAASLIQCESSPMWLVRLARLGSCSASASWALEWQRAQDNHPAIDWVLGTGTLILMLVWQTL